MATVDFPPHENLLAWAGVEPATFGVQGQRHTNYATQLVLDQGLQNGFCTTRMDFILYCDRHPIHLQWVGSHVGPLGNEVADDFAKGATSNPVDPEDHMVLTSTEIYSRAQELICRTWVVPPVHPWYFQRHPGSAISFKDSRSYQTVFS
ncbi:RNase H domain-containing protein [Trichonephila clavipes]|nr:RNase H domain-containing protein [Trichonephila clavipes]